MIRKILLLLVLCLFQIAESESVKLAKGQLAEKVNSISYPGFSHAIYIPTRYDPSTKWPVLYCFDARKQGKLFAELFREAAEKYGYIIVSSNDSESDDPNAKNIEAMRAAWADSHAWFAIDDRRTYATGFSGGARLAWGMGTVYSLAGVIGCGAGTHADRPPSKEIEFVYFGIAGNTDFNYNELRQLKPVLDSFGITNRIENFDGSHRWPPKEVCTRAIEWMEIQAIKQDRRTKDSTLVDQIFQDRLQEARELETSGSTFDTFLRFQQLAEDFSELLDVNEYKNKAEALAKTDEVRKRLELQKKIEKEEEKTVGNFRQLLGEFRNSSANPSAAKIKSDLRINHWQEQKRDRADTEEGLLAERLLQIAFTQTAFYLPSYFNEKQDHRRALVSLSVASEIYPDYWPVWYNLACSQVKNRDKKKALETLKIAIEKGFTDEKLLSEDPDLASIREEPEFQQILQSLQK